MSVLRLSVLDLQNLQQESQEDKNGLERISKVLAKFERDLRADSNAEETLSSAENERRDAI